MKIIDIAKIKDADELKKICLQEKRRTSKPVKQRGAKQNAENNSRKGK